MPTLTNRSKVEWPCLTLQLPPVEEVKRPERLRQLTEEAAQGDTSNWEAGAQSNFMIAAARLGLRVASAANIGQDVYGDFLATILKVSLPFVSTRSGRVLAALMLCFWG